MTKINPSEITPKDAYYSRRDFIKAAMLATGGAILAGCTPAASTIIAPTNSDIATGDSVAPPAATGLTDELGDPANSYEQITNYNNYYEFTTNKERVAAMARNFPTSPWEVSVEGLVNNPGTFDIDDLKALGQEERIYRLRCVEGWSMVIPWVGFPLAALLNLVEPTSDAKYVQFTTLYAPDLMPGQNNGWYEWPYVEGLRLDEAMNDLTLMATGLYGEDLPPQNGAPLRLVVPWKYGFKSIKAIVKIELTAFQPISLWEAAQPNEYGFYANVNPQVDHPRWSQASERRIGEFSRRPTLMFNGYEEQVSYLYEGMDLRINY